MRSQQGKSPNNKLNVACIGVGGRGNAAVTAMKGENLVAFCDVDEVRAAKNFKEFPDVPRFSDYRKLLDKLGEECTAELYVFVTEHKQMGLNWNQIFTQQTVLLAQMKNGLKWMDRQEATKAPPAEPGVDPDRRRPIDGVDYYMRAHGEGVLRLSIVGGVRTDEPFDEDVWRASRQRSA